MASPWSVFIPAAAAATFAATWLLTPAPQAGAAAPLPQPPAEQPAPIVTHPARTAALPVGPSVHHVRPTVVRAGAALLRPRPAVLRTRPAPVDSVFYSGCNEVRAAGKAPLYRGQPGYREGMDGDLDGIACEPHRNRW